VAISGRWHGMARRTEAPPEAETRERLAGAERDDVTGLLVLGGEHVEADQQVAAGVGFSPVDAKRKLAVRAGGDQRRRGGGPLGMSHGWRSRRGLDTSPRTGHRELRILGEQA
jgi:hypothetical protein